MQEPKTWTAESYINYEDFNRMMANLKEVYDLAITMYPVFTCQASTLRTATYSSLGNAKLANYPGASLKEINDATVNIDIGETITYSANGSFWKYDDLNRIEQKTLEIYNLLQGRSNGMRHLAFKLGREGVFSNCRR